MPTKHTQQHTKDGRAEGTLRSYTLGFVLSIVATLVPYFVLVGHVASGTLFVMVAVTAALVQLFVQLVLFLHLSFKKRSQANLIVFAYTVILVGAIVVGTLWIMYHLNKNMTENVYPAGDYSPQTEAY